MKHRKLNSILHTNLNEIFFKHSLENNILRNILRNNIQKNYKHLQKIKKFTKLDEYKEIKVNKISIKTMCVN